MESKLAQQAKQALVASLQALTPAQRLNAFLAHCQLMAALNRAGEQRRLGARGRR